MSLRKEIIMSVENKIINLMNKNKGYITTKMISENNIARFFLTKMVNEKKLEKVGRGLYMDPAYFTCDYYKYQTISKYCIYSLETALYLHDLSDRVPIQYNISVPRNYSGILTKFDDIKLNYVSDEIYNVGVININSPFDMPIRVYDLERTICDIIKYKSKVDIEIFSTALRRYSKLENKNLYNLICYAKLLNIETKVRDYMEILL